MGDQYIGEIRPVSFGSAPKGWALCNGQTLPVNQNQALFAVISNRYGGDGVTTFKLPNLQGQVPIGQGNGYAVGQAGGEAMHTLSVAEIPAHSHAPGARSVASTPGSDPTNSVWAASDADMFYAGPPGADTMSTAAIGSTGGSAPHENRSPYLVVNFMIALTGVFPTQN